jgi:hypothetical protein
MQQIKIFKALEHETQKLEDTINQWIAQSGVRVLQISGKIAPQTELPDGADAPMRKHLYPCSDLLVVLLYETPAK